MHLFLVASCYIPVDEYINTKLLPSQRREVLWEATGSPAKPIDSTLRLVANEPTKSTDGTGMNQGVLAWIVPLSWMDVRLSIKQ